MKLQQQKPIRISDRLMNAWLSVQREERKHLRPNQEKRLRPLAEEIWRAYTTKRKGLGGLQLTRSDYALAYHLTFHLANLARQLIPLTRLKSSLDSWSQSRSIETIKVIDLGAGTGAASMAVIDFLATSTFPKAQFEVLLVDRSRSLLELATRGMEALELGKRLSLQTQVSQLGRDEFKVTPPNSNGLTIVVLSYVWNEFATHRNSRARLERDLNSLFLGESPAWVFINEPSSEQQARRAMELRDLLVSRGAIPQYPCPSTTKICPLAAGRDWCFSETPYEEPEAPRGWLPDLDRSQKVLGCASYVFTNASGAVVGPSAPRIVGRPSTKSQAWLITCGKDGLSRKPMGYRPPTRAWALTHPRGLMVPTKTRV